MGFGDVKLAFGMGMMLGVGGGLSALVFAVWVGAIVSLCLIGINRLARRRGRLTMKSEIPFGPFLVFGTFFVFFTQITLLSVLGIM
jgi:leader peptidase (prepilin peptidase)/N-methyltransferase